MSKRNLSMTTPQLISQSRPNPNAKIGFVVSHPFHFYVCKNVYRHLRERAEFIIDTGADSLTEPPPHTNALIELFKKNDIRFRVLHQSNYSDKSYLQHFFKKYSALVCLMLRGAPRLSCNADKKKVHLVYTVAKELGNFSFSKRRYDLILAYGNKDCKIFSLYARAEIVGNPKFDDWFNDDVDEESVAVIRGKINQNKKTILYLPTHGDLSSILPLMPRLKDLYAHYNIVVKPHHLIAYEPEKIKALCDNKIILFWDDMDLLPLLKTANVVVTDNSGVLFEMALSGKPVVATDFLSDDFFENEHKQFRSRTSGTPNPLSYAQSIEQRVKREGAVRTIRKPEEIAVAISEMLQDDGKFHKEQSGLIQELFSFNDGRCGERAANAILKLLSEDIPPVRPLFYHLIENFKRELDYKHSRQKKSRRKHESSFYQQIKDIWNNS